MLGWLVIIGVIGVLCCKGGILPAMFGIDFILEIGVFCIMVVVGYGFVCFFF